MGNGQSNQQSDAAIPQTGDTAAQSGEDIGRSKGIDRGNAGTADAAIQQHGITAAHSGTASSTMQGTDRDSAGAADAALQQTGSSAAQSGETVGRMQGPDRSNAGAADAAIQQTGDMAARSGEAASRTQGIDWDIATAPAKQRSQQKLLGMMQRLPGDALQLVIPLALSAAVMRWTLGALDPNKDAKRAGKRRADALSKRLGRRIHLQDLEHVVAQDVVFPENVDVSLQDIGGLEPVEDILKTKVLLPLQRPDLFQSNLLRLNKGILLYGPPGTGKTMLAKALAKESGAAFINITAASMQSKWYGETSRLVAALFRVARKVAPTIIFIDEVDALLGRRKDGDHEATTNLKTEFMQHWDGLLPADATHHILVLGATNRPAELDAAVMRRFSLQLEVPMPGVPQREAILTITLWRHAAEVGATQVHPQLLANQAPGPGEKKPLQLIAEDASGLSGSDLQQLCSLAASRPVLELAQSSAANPYSRPRPVNAGDFQAALTELRAARATDTARLAEFT